MSKILLVCGDQLFPPARYRKLFPAADDRLVLMVEDRTLCSRRRFHQQKLALVLTAMREQAIALRDAGYRVRYFSLEDEQTLAGALRVLAAEGDFTTLEGFAVINQHQSRWIDRAVAAAGLDRRIEPSPMFLTDDATFEALAGQRRPAQMGRFYQAQRQRLDVLMAADGEPEGGRYSFDEDNRKALPANQAVPELPTVHLSTTGEQVAELVANRFPDSPGNAAELWLPTDRRGALRWLRTFLKDRFHGFGTYEDAISTRSPTLFHSAMSPLLNLGLLTPDEVLEKAIAAAREQQVAVNDVEGFVRQLIGWREFIRGIYVTDGQAMRSHNARNQQRRMKQGWFDGTLGLPPYDDAIRTLRSYGWNHHIERLMVIANLMNLAEIEPGQVYDFFLDHYLDAYDWVMVPNVYGMGLNSDANTFATKPYICGSNYWLKMSDYRKGDWCNVVDGLYWRFVREHREALARNPRTAVMPRNLDRLKAERRSTIFAAADRFLEQHTEAAS